MIDLSHPSKSSRVGLDENVKGGLLASKQSREDKKTFGTFSAAPSPSFSESVASRLVQTRL